MPEPWVTSGLGGEIRSKVQCDPEGDGGDVFPVGRRESRQDPPAPAQLPLGDPPGFALELQAQGPFPRRLHRRWSNPHADSIAIRSSACIR